ncbi:MAG: glycosyl hydrolase [Verrucomicrobiaceae bacterium]|nr:glycosyl hydrolase [Verrucomicrobiaceae bacterium]NCF91839.1 glycosyl hydrolase [Verrucomicrobiaceae bacterium]
MIQAKPALKPVDLKPALEEFWKLSGQKISLIRDRYDHAKGSPVFTEAGNYTTRGWTEWTQGFEFGSAILQFDATGDEEALDYGRTMTMEKMAPHVSHFGVHDHGFNNVSTYGNLLRLMQEGRLPNDQWEKNFYEIALKVSGAVQAYRWTTIPDGGYIYSFNGPHSLFVDTIRSCRALVVSWLLKHQFMAEGDKEICLLERAIQHGMATAKYSVFYGEGRDSYDEWGRTAHESVFNTNDGAFRCPNSQQGYTGFTTWTRGLAWAMCGFAEELEMIDQLDTAALSSDVDWAEVKATFLKAARATCDFYMANTPTDGIPYWDAGAPGLVRMGDYLDRKSDPYNDHEPIDSSAAAIGAQGLLRLGRYLGDEGQDYWQAGLTVLETLLQKPYLSTDADHQGLLLHSIYHQPNGWDHVPEGSKIANGESSMWGDYHMRELALYVQREAEGQPYYRYFDCVR